jgi:hypothetical protein
MQLPELYNVDRLHFDIYKFSLPFGTQQQTSLQSIASIFASWWVVCP